MGLGGLRVAMAGTLLMSGALACSLPHPEDPVPVVPLPTGIARGEAAFHDHALAGLGGNGRSCADCHMDSRSFQLGPADVEARFRQMRLTGVDDPLFRPVDADDFVTNGASASDYGN